MQKFSEFVLSSTQPPHSAVGDAPEQSVLESELAVLLVESLNLEIAPSEIVPTAPLYGEGLGLDSIDILEVALEVSRKYGFQLRSDDERNQQIFQSLRSLATHVAQNRGDS
ncbi:acyl carrier protein [Variovorax paradoxus]|nr:acyl carrier protein [Variovorax paradoxus]